MPFRKLLIYIGGVLLIIWGVVHMFPTSSVVKGFGNISSDNVRIINMEWITEGMALIFIGVLAIIVTLVSSGYNRVIRSVYMLAFIMLEAMSVLSLFTGFGINFLPYKLCPVIFTFSGLLIMQGAFVRSTK